MTAEFFLKARESLRPEGIIVFDPAIRRNFDAYDVFKNEEDSEPEYTLHREVFYYLPDLLGYIEDSNSDFRVPFKGLLNPPTIKLFPQVEKEFKETFIGKLGFTDIELYVNTCFNNAKMAATLKDINETIEKEIELLQLEHETTAVSKQEPIQYDGLRRESELLYEEIVRVATKSAILDMEANKPYQVCPPAYFKYPFILDPYSLEFRYMSKPPIFAVLKK